VRRCQDLYCADLPVCCCFGWLALTWLSCADLPVWQVAVSQQGEAWFKKWIIAADKGKAVCFAVFSECFGLTWLSSRCFMPSKRSFKTTLEVTVQPSPSTSTRPSAASLTPSEFSPSSACEDARICLALTGVCWQDCSHPSPQCWRSPRVERVLHPRGSVTGCS
jgi:hypothetical protein